MENSWEINENPTQMNMIITLSLEKRGSRSGATSYTTYFSIMEIFPNSKNPKKIKILYKNNMQPVYIILPQNP